MNTPTTIAGRRGAHGSALGSYHYIIEAESVSGVTDKQIDKVCGHAVVRFLGSYNAVEK